MEKSENRLVQIFESLRYEGKVRTRRDFADLLGVNYANLVSAMNGDPRSYTPRLIAKAEKALETPIPAPTPTPKEVAIPSDLLGIIATQAETIRSQQEVIARLTGVETKKGAV